MMQTISKFRTFCGPTLLVHRPIITPRRHFCESQRYSPEKPFLVLGIETSCDDTAASVVSSEGNVLGESISSQFEVHQPYGGIVPVLAARVNEHFFSSSESGKTFKDFHSIAVTTGPGLTPCLRVGIAKAKDLAREHNLPIISINHLEGHAFVARMQEEEKRVPFPFLFLLLSGGHSQILLCRGISDFYHLGGTLDDSLGEAFDKVARLLGSEFAHGSFLEEMAQKGDASRYKLPLMMKKYKNCDFSFAGLKSAAARLVRESREEEHISPDSPLPSQLSFDIAAAFQSAAILHVEEKTKFALKWCASNIKEPIPHMVVAGGVARNIALRERLNQLAETFSMKLLYPELSLCTDNASMIAWAAIELLESGKAFERGLVFSPARFHEIQERARWPLSEHFEPFDSHLYPSESDSLKDFVYGED